MMKVKTISVKFEVHNYVYNLTINSNRSGKGMKGLYIYIYIYIYIYTKVIFDINIIIYCQYNKGHHNLC